MQRRLPVAYPWAGRAIDCRRPYRANSDLAPYNLQGVQGGLPGGRPGGRSRQLD